jgi:hypothetical protein
MSNIFQINDILEGLDDGQLQMQMKNPSAGVPQYMVLAEMQKRQKMRAEASVPNNPPPVTTVADDIMSQGVAGLPEMASGEDAPGGVAACAGGGAVEAARGFPYSNYPSGGPPEGDWEFEDSPLGRYWRRVKEQMANSMKMPEPDRPFGQVVADSVKRGVQNIQMPKVPQALKDIDAEVGRSQQEMLRLVGRGNGTAQAATVPPPVSDAYPEQRRVANSVSAEFPLPVEETPAPAPKAARGGGKRVSGGIPAVAAAKGIPAPAPAGATYTPAEALPRITDPEMKSAQDYLEMVRANSPDRTGEMVARQDQRLAENAKGKDAALSQALMEAGLGIMAAGGKNGSFLGAIGEGGIGGLKTYAAQMNAVRDREDKINTRREDLMMAQDAAKRGDFKTAAEIADKYNTRQMTLHGQNVAERRADMEFQQRDKQFGLGVRKLDEQMQLEREKMAVQERMANAQNATTIKAAGIRASSGGIASLGGMDSKAIKAATSEYNKIITQMQKAEPFSQFSGETPDQYRARIRARALQELSPQYQQALGMALNVNPAPAQQQKIMKLGVDGFYQ